MSFTVLVQSHPFVLNSLSGAEEDTEIKTLVRQSLQLPHFQPTCVTAPPRGSTLEMGEREREDSKRKKKKNTRNTAGMLELWTSPAVLKTMNSSSPLRAYVVRNSQRGPSAPTETTGVTSMLADIQETRPTYNSLFASWQVIDKHPFFSSSLFKWWLKKYNSQFFPL